MSARPPSGDRTASERATTRAIRAEFFRAALSCVGSCLLGLVVMGMGLHATDADTGMVFWWGGLVLGYAGITISLAVAYRRGESRGYW